MSSETAASDRFFAVLEPVSAFERLALPRSYTPLPDDWSIAVADVIDSTAAVREGRYKHVNTVGVSVIAALRNALKPVEVPYVFGGDGALVCFPGRLEGTVRSVVAATMAMAKTSFELELRACVVPVRLVREWGLDVQAARHAVSGRYVQCALYGGGATAIEDRLKRGELPETCLVQPDPSGVVDYSGLECRWNEVPSPSEETVAVIVEARCAPAEALPTYRQVMERIRLVYGEPDVCRPVEEAGLSVALSSSVLENELKLRHWTKGRLTRLIDGLKLRAQLLLGYVLVRRGMVGAGTDWGRYKSDLVLNTDFRKFDGCLRLVVSGTAEQRQALAEYLEGLRDEGHIDFGVHVARSALMTCLVESRDGGHFHFIDASGGGYAAAAAALKTDRSRRDGGGGT